MAEVESDGGEYCGGAKVFFDRIGEVEQDTWQGIFEDAIIKAVAKDLNMTEEEFYDVTMNWGAL